MLSSFFSRNSFSFTNTFPLLQPIIPNDTLRAIFYLVLQASWSVDMMLAQRERLLRKPRVTPLPSPSSPTTALFAPLSSHLARALEDELRDAREAIQVCWG